MICDVSKHQGKIDWDLLAPNLDFCMIKASGKTKDPCYAKNAAECKRLGIPFHAYHFLYCATEARAKKEAQMFFNAVGDTKPLFWVLDCEAEWGCANSKARMLAEVFEAELRRLAGNSIKIAVYIGHNKYKDYALDYGRYAYVWIPRYKKVDDGQPNGTKPDFYCDIWQYTSNGRLAGINGRVDLNKLVSSRPMSYYTGKTIEPEKEEKTMTAPDKLISIAEAEIGYLEKKSNKDLDDKTANAGSANYTKYNRDMKAWAGSAGLHDQWCQNFVDWCFVTAFGLDDAKKLIYTFTNYTPTGSGAFKKKSRYIKRGAGKPKRGDVIYFFSTAKGRIGHVGIVYKVSGSKVYTIEGNTSGASTLVTNGGGVRKKSYKLTSTYIDGYGSVDYSSITGEIDPGPETLKLGDRELMNYTEGPDVKELQEALISLGYDCGAYGADGEFGDCTEIALRKFQKDAGITVDGVFDEEDLEALNKALDDADKPVENPKYVVIKGGQVYIRSEPNKTTSKKLGIARKDSQHEYAGETTEDNWLKIKYKDGTAWVSGKYAKLVK